MALDEEEEEDLPPPRARDFITADQHRLAYVKRFEDDLMAMRMQSSLSSQN